MSTPVTAPRKAGGSKFWLSVLSVFACVVAGIVAGLLSIDLPDSVYVAIAGINGGHAIGNVGEYFGKAAQQKYLNNDVGRAAVEITDVVEESLRSEPNGE
jgi:hypothetical protein